MIETIQRADVEAVAAIDPYYRGRAEYLLAAADMVRRHAPQDLSPADVLEVGAYKLPIVPGCDTMDYRGDRSPTWLGDARQPWPMSNNTFELLIALQVFEHLAGKQAEAFAEARRVCSGPILLSLPYRWTAGGDHAGIDEARIASWTHTFPTDWRIVGALNAARILCLWR